MKKLEDYLKLTQTQLFNTLRKKYRGKNHHLKDEFILVKGKAPIILVAHLDTVHIKPVRDICKTADGNIIMSPQGIGGDDRCGVYALVKTYETSTVKPWLLFTCEEEVGGLGAITFCDMYRKGELPKELSDIKLIVEIDRRGSKDAVYYDCDNIKFEDYITNKGFKTEYGSFSDISYIAPELGVAAVNLSSGYYNAHTLHEYINRKVLEDVIAKVVEIVSDSTAEDFPKYEYVERKKQSLIAKYGADLYKYSKFDSPVRKKVSRLNIKPIPAKYVDMYDCLLDFYDEEEIEEYRNIYGDEIIKELYDQDFGFYGAGSYYCEEEENDKC